MRCWCCSKRPTKAGASIVDKKEAFFCCLPFLTKKDDDDQNFFVFLRVCFGILDERDAKEHHQKTSFVEFIILFHRRLALKIAKKKRALITPPLFYARRRRRRASLLWGVDFDRGRGQFSNEFRRRSKNDDEEKFPIGTRYLINRNEGKNFSWKNTVRSRVLALTFLSYTMYHATRKPPSIVKSVLNPDSTQRELETGAV